MGDWMNLVDGKIKGEVLLDSVENKAKFENHLWDNEKAY